MFKSAHLKVSAVWITLVVSYEVFCNVKVTTFASNVERSATIRCGSFYFNMLFVRLSGPHTKSCVHMTFTNEVDSLFTCILYW